VRHRASPDRGDAVAKDAADHAAHATCALVAAGRLDLAQHGEHLLHFDLVDRQMAEERIDLSSSQRTLLSVTSARSSRVILSNHSSATPLNVTFASICARSFRRFFSTEGSTPSATILRARIALVARLGEADLRPDAEREVLPFPRKR
jgi:hypothetical protein